MKATSKKKVVFITAGAVIIAMMFGTPKVYADDSANAVKELIDALSTTVQQIQTDLGLVKQQVADANTAAQDAKTTAENSITQAQNANLTATNANDTAQQSQQQVEELKKEVETLKSTIDAQQSEINNLRGALPSSQQVTIHIGDYYGNNYGYANVDGLEVVVTDQNGKVFFTGKTDSTGIVKFNVPNDTQSYHYTVTGYHSVNSYEQYGKFDTKTSLDTQSVYSSYYVTNGDWYFDK